VVTQAEVATRPSCLADDGPTEHNTTEGTLVKGVPVAMVDHDHLTPVPIDHHATPAVFPLAYEEQTTRTRRSAEVVDVGHVRDGTPQAVRSAWARCGWRNDEYNAVVSAEGRTWKVSHKMEAIRRYWLRAMCRCPVSV
jgi:hypothetical protein